jgi:dihydroorotase
MQRRLAFFVFRPILLLFLLATSAGVLPAQPVYDLLLKGGHVIDPANEIDRISDVAILGNQIAEVAENIPPGKAKQVVDATGLYVTPGLIDTHAHVFGLPGSLFPDDTALIKRPRSSIAGAGWRTLTASRPKSSTEYRRVLALNIVGEGMVSSPKATPTTWTRKPPPTKFASTPSSLLNQETRSRPTGVFVLKRAIEAALPTRPSSSTTTSTRSEPRYARELLDIMRPGDLHTHMYNDQQMHLVDRFSDEVRPELREARRRGVLFDLGHGGSSFLWPVAAHAMEGGFPPDVISTDLHSGSVMNQVDMPNCISKLMSLGMGLQEAIMRSTVNPAKAIRKFPNSARSAAARQPTSPCLNRRKASSPSWMPEERSRSAPNACTACSPSATARSSLTKTASHSMGEQ